METEIKFEVPDGHTLARLESQDRLAGFAVHRTRAESVNDRYLDTPDRRLLRSGWSLRLRRRSTSPHLLATIKALTSAEGALHRREELEASVLGADPAAWPSSDVRQMVSELARDQPLVELFSLEQNRTVAMLQDGEREVAELSLDEVRFTDGSTGTQTMYELEAELRAGGMAEDLTRLRQVLSEEWDLQPQPLSKFERGLELASRGPQADTRR